VILADLIDPISQATIAGNANTVVGPIVYDSRKVTPGSVFIALRGTASDGHDFVDQAIAAGACAIIADRSAPLNHDVPWVHVPDTRKALALISAMLHHHPSKNLRIVGVTGTNGKTTTTYLLHYLANKAFQRAGLIGTVVYDVGVAEQRHATHTPESTEVQSLLAEMRDNGCRAAVMEVSSHALDQHRVYGIQWAGGVFTNLTQDHLDYHETMDRYFEAKATLFQKIADQPDGQIIINIDDLYGKRLASRFDSTKRVVRYGFGTAADFRATDVRYDASGTQFQLTAKGRQLLVRTPLIGDFNVYNALAALACSRPLGFNMREAVEFLRTAPQVPGRLERVSEPKHAIQIFVDYAHTPDALVNALKTLKQLRPNRIITLFGCGGDRDRSKRPLMAHAAEQGSTICILTTDNPRFEDPQQILDDTKFGFHGTNFEVIPDRATAIKAAIDMAEAGDIVLIAGKGHEEYQDIKGVKTPFSDAYIATGAFHRLTARDADRRRMRQGTSFGSRDAEHQRTFRPTEADGDFRAPDRTTNSPKPRKWME
jgi:UDP-N-acetylmuramoyl-L-alanyl-D-glutamate--2,6-diaminopimelate ligase